MKRALSPPSGERAGETTPFVPQPRLGASLLANWGWGGVGEGIGLRKGISAPLRAVQRVREHAGLGADPADESLRVQPFLDSDDKVEFESTVAPPPAIPKPSSPQMRTIERMRDEERDRIVVEQENIRRAAELDAAKILLSEANDLIALYHSSLSLPSSPSIPFSTPAFDSIPNFLSLDPHPFPPSHEFLPSDLYSSLSRLISFVSEVIIHLISASLHGSLTVRTIFHIYNLLSDIPKVEERFDLDVLAFDLVTPLAVSRVLGTHLSLEEIEDHQDETLSSLQRFAEEIFRFLRPRVNFLTSAMWSFLIEGVIPHHIFSSIRQEWRPGHLDYACIDILDSFVTRFDLSGKIEYFIMLPLLEAIDSWDAYSQVNQLRFVQRWGRVEFINGERLELAFVAKVKSRLDLDWNITNASLLQFLESCAQFLPQTLYLLHEECLSRVELSLQNYVINPADQCVNDFLDLISWRAFLGVGNILDLLEEYFFPRWLLVFSVWLGNSQEQKLKFFEIGRWYIGWRDLLSDQNLLYPNVILQLDRALHLCAVHLQP